MDGVAVSVMPLKYCLLFPIALFAVLWPGDGEAHDYPIYPWYGVYEWDDGRRVMLDDIADARSLLGDVGYRDYTSLLQEMACEDATALLRAAFVARYREFADIAKPDSELRINWEHSFVAKKYRDLHFCNTVYDLERIFSDKSLREEKMWPYAFNPEQGSRHWKATIRDIKIRDLITLSDRQFGPAMIYMADLAALGFVFQKSPQVEYFMLQRACAIGYRCAEMHGRIALLEDELPLEERAAMTEIAHNLWRRVWDYLPGHERSQH